MERGATLFAGLVGALQLVLHEASGDEETLLGAPAAGRERPELQEQVGFHPNVTLRGTVRRAETFATLLDRARVTVTEALANQNYPFDLLVDELAPAREFGRSPIFDVQINLMPGETPPMRLGELGVGGFVGNSGTTIFDLNFMFSEGQRGLMLEVGYSTALFDPATVASLGDRVLRLARWPTVAADPEQTVRSLCRRITDRADASEREAFLAASLDLGGGA